MMMMMMMMMSSADPVAAGGLDNQMPQQQQHSANQRGGGLTVWRELWSSRAAILTFVTSLFPCCLKKILYDTLIVLEKKNTFVPVGVMVPGAIKADHL